MIELNVRQRARLVDILLYRQRGSSPADCLFKDDRTGRSLLDLGLIQIYHRHSKQTERIVPGTAALCCLTDEGVTALGDL
jgi:hypothetical protein